MKICDRCLNDNEVYTHQVSITLEGETTFNYDATDLCQLCRDEFRDLIPKFWINKAKRGAKNEHS